jgi:CRP-like cAMP-binding protein
MPESTRPNLLNVAASLATGPHGRMSLIPEAETLDRRRRNRGAQLQARRQSLGPESVLALSGAGDGVQASGRDPRDVASVRLTAGVVPALKEFVDAAAWRQLVAGSATIHTLAGNAIYPSATRSAMLVVVAGVARVRTRTPSGRHVTTRYARVGDALAISAASIRTNEAWTEAATDTTVVLLPLRQLRALANGDAQLAKLIGAHLTAPQDEFRLGAAAPESDSIMTARIAGHLLEMTAPTTAGAASVDVSVRRLAVVAGTAGAITSRVVRRLRAAGVVDARPGAVVIADRRRLSQIARGREDIL